VKSTGIKLVPIPLDTARDTGITVPAPRRGTDTSGRQVSPYRPSVLSRPCPGPSVVHLSTRLEGIAVDVGRRQLPPVVGEAPRDPSCAGLLPNHCPVLTGPLPTGQGAGRGEIRTGDSARDVGESEEVGEEIAADSQRAARAPDERGNVGKSGSCQLYRPLPHQAIVGASDRDESEIEHPRLSGRRSGRCGSPWCAGVRGAGGESQRSGESPGGELHRATSEAGGLNHSTTLKTKD